MSDEFALVRIKAVCAFDCILKHKDAQDLVKPLLQDILGVYLRLLEKYDLESLVNSLERIIQNFSTQIGLFTAQLRKYFFKLFIKMFQNDITKCNNEDYVQQEQLPISRCLKALTQIFDASSINQENLINLEIQIIQLCKLIFSSSGSHSLDYTMEILTLLNSYLKKIDKITNQRIWFYYQIIIFNIVGIPKSASQQQFNKLDETQKKIMNNFKNSDNLQIMEQSMPVLINFIRKGLSNIILNPFTQNLLNLLCYLVQIYEKEPKKITGEIYRMCSTTLLIYLVQNNKESLPGKIFTKILYITELNIKNTKSKTLKILNSQLLGLLLWVNSPAVLNYMQKQNILFVFLKQLLSYQQKYEQKYQRRRLILGLNTLIQIPQRPKQIIKTFPLIFESLIKLIKKNTINRINDQRKKFLEFRDEDLDNTDLESQDDKQFWQQMYNENYTSPLDLIDQVDHFQKSILKMQNEQNSFIHQMIKIIKPEELIELDSLIQQLKASIQRK